MFDGEKKQKQSTIVMYGAGGLLTVAFGIKVVRGVPRDDHVGLARHGAQSHILPDGAHVLVPKLKSDIFAAEKGAESAARARVNESTERSITAE